MIIDKIKIGNDTYNIGARYQDIDGTPTKTSDFTNDGDGNSNYATEEYVGLNGGKIDKIKVNNVEQTITNKTVNISVPTKTSDITNDNGFIDKNVNDLVNYTPSDETTTRLELVLDNTTFKLKGILKDSSNNVIYTSNEIDLPLETMVVNASYDSLTKELVLTLVNGTNVRVDISALVSGLVSTTDLATALQDYYTKSQIDGLLSAKQNTISNSNKLNSDLVDDTNSTNKFVTSAEKNVWNNKSDFSGSYNDLTNKPTIPDELSDLQDDSTHRLVTDTEKSTWNNKSDFSGNYNDLTNKPTIPSAIQYSTMPTASATTVGTIVQYVGTTDSTYTNGYFYIGTTDGEETPTYSWENINVQESSGGSAIKTYIFKDLNISENIQYDSGTPQFDVLKEIFDTVNNTYTETGTSYKLLNVVVNSSTYPPFTVWKRYYNNENTILSIANFWNGAISSGNISNVGALYPVYYLTIIKGANETYYKVSRVSSVNRRFYGDPSLEPMLLSNATSSGNGKVLGIDNTAQYTPTNDYHPATKKYVDETVASGGASDLPEFTLNLTGIKYYDGVTTDYDANSMGLVEENIVSQTTDLFNWIKTNITSGNSFYLNLSISFTTPALNTTNSTLPEKIKIYNTPASKWKIKCTRKTNAVEISLVELLKYTGYLKDFQVYHFNLYISGLNSSSYSSQTYQSVFMSFPTSSYVKTLPTTYSGYDATKTQVLKNVNGTLTWVDEA